MDLNNIKNKIELYMKKITRFISLLFLIFCLTSCHSEDEELVKEHGAASTELIKIVDSNSELKAMLEKSIAMAKQQNPDKATNPAQTLDEYYDFIDWATTAMPWGVISQPEGTDLFTRIDQSLNYLFFINDQKLEELDGKGLYNNSLQYYSPYREWLKTFAESWGQYLDTEASWSDEYYQMAYNQPVFGLDKGWYEDKSQWKTFNQFFARQLSSPSVRPIASPDDDTVIAAAADSKPQGVWGIDEDGYIINEVQIKSKKFFSVAELLGPNSKYKNTFNGGTMTHSFLNVFDYHRYHFPMSGTIKEVSIVAGDYAVGGEVKWNATNKTYDLYCDEPSWQSIETRGCVVLETPSNGLVAILPIGMMPVTSINWESNIKVGYEAKKGDMLGYFLFGGSDIVILFQKGYQFNLTVPKDGSGYEHQYQGEELGRVSHH